MSATATVSRPFAVSFGLLALVNLMPWVAAAFVDQWWSEDAVGDAFVAVVLYGIPGWLVRWAVLAALSAVGRRAAHSESQLDLLGFALLVCAEAAALMFVWWTSEWSTFVLGTACVVRVLDAAAVAWLSRGRVVRGRERRETLSRVMGD